MTPLQIATATAAIANGGVVYRPHIVERVTDPNTAEVQPIEPQIISELSIDPVHLQTVRSGMRACVEWGSCRRMSSMALDIAGKTGTAQWSSVKAHHAWFTGFAPYQNPEIVITVLVEEGEEGSKAALPVAMEFLQAWAVHDDR